MALRPIDDRAIDRIVIATRIALGLIDAASDDLVGQGPDALKRRVRLAECSQRIEASLRELQAADPRTSDDPPTVRPPPHRKTSRESEIVTDRLPPPPLMPRVTAPPRSKTNPRFPSPPPLAPDEHEAITLPATEKPEDT
jgi:hypothetical protein